MEAVFDALERERQVGKEQLVELAADDGDKDDVLALATDCIAMVWEFKGFAEAAVFVPKLHGQAVDGVGHALRRAVAGGVATGIGNESEAGNIHEEDLLDLEAVGFFKYDVFVGAAGKERLEVPDEAIDGAGTLERSGRGRILRQGAPYGGTHHGFEKRVDAAVPDKAGASQGFMDERSEGFEEIGVGEIWKRRRGGWEERRNYCGREEIGGRGK